MDIIQLSQNKDNLNNILKSQTNKQLFIYFNILPKYLLEEDNLDLYLEDELFAFKIKSEENITSEKYSIKINKVENANFKKKKKKTINKEKKGNTKPKNKIKLSINLSNLSKNLSNCKLIKNCNSTRNTFSKNNSNKKLVNNSGAKAFSSSMNKSEKVITQKKIKVQNYSGFSKYKYKEN